MLTYTHATPQYAAISVSSSGDNTIVTGVTGLAITVASYMIIPASQVTMTWKNGGVALSGAIAVGGSNQPVGLGGGHNEYGWFATSPGNSLILNLGAGVQVSGYITYFLGSIYAI